MAFVNAIAHYFYPGHTNDHKAKLLHSTTIAFIVLSLFVYQFILQAVPTTGVKILGYAANIPPERVTELTNQKRSAAGVGELQYSEVLARAAREKGEHMLANDYWAHVAPDGTEPWDFFVKNGYNYRFAGENLARDFSNPESAVEAWVSSPSHKENLLSSKYSEIGIAVVEGDMNGVDTTIIVQLFGTPLSGSGTEASIAEAATEAVPTVAPTLPPAQPTQAITVTPTAAPTSTPGVGSIAQLDQDERITTQAQATEEGQSGFSTLISPFDTTRGVSLVTIILLLSIMVIDGLVTWRRKTPRIAGRTFAHMAFLGMILAIALIAQAGQIL